MSIKTLALAVAVVTGMMGFASRADAQVIVQPTVSSSYYVPGNWGTSYVSPGGLVIGSPYYGGYYTSGYYGNGYYGSYYGFPYYGGYYGGTTIPSYGVTSYPYYGGGSVTSYGVGRRGWRW